MLSIQNHEEDNTVLLFFCLDAALFCIDVAGLSSLPLNGPAKHTEWGSHKYWMRGSSSASHSKHGNHLVISISQKHIRYYLSTPWMGSYTFSKHRDALRPAPEYCRVPKAEDKASRAASLAAPSGAKSLQKTQLIETEHLHLPSQVTSLNSEC